MDNLPTITSDPYNIIAEAERKHNIAKNTMRSLRDCLDGAVIVNAMLNMGIDNGDITEELITYDNVRRTAETLDIMVGEKTTRSADRHLIATYVCVSRGIPIPND